TGTRFQFVPYRGGAPMIQDLVAGQIDLTFTQVASSLTQVRAGQIKAYAVMAKTRGWATPETPTIDEAGMPGLYASFWHGLWAPKRTHKDVIAKLHAALVDTLADPVVRQRLTDVGQEIWPRDKQTPEALAAQQKAEIEKWWPIIKAANIKRENAALLRLCWGAMPRTFPAEIFCIWPRALPRCRPCRALLSRKPIRRDRCV